MVKQSIRKSLSVLLIPLLGTNVSAYTPGSISYSADLTEITETDRVTVENGNIILSVGGSVTLDIFIPFDACEMELAYEADASLKLAAELNGESKINTLQSGTGTTVFDFTDNICKMGNGSLTINSQLSDITITDITFNKVDSWYPEVINRDILYSAYDAAMQTSAVFNTELNVFKDMGGIKYVSYENTALKPILSENILFVPVEAAASALDLYMEEQEGGVLFRNDENTIESTVPTVDNDGIAYVSLRETANAFGAYIYEKEGYYIVDYYKLRVKQIVNDAEIFSQLKNELALYVDTDLDETEEYHVSSSISKSGDGTAENPFKTISEAAAVADAGDTVIIHEGIYRETVTPKNCGTPMKPITFKAAPGEAVTVSAFDTINGFKHYDKDIYVAKLPVELDFGTNMILFSGSELAEARQPNTHTALSDKIADYPDEVTSPLWPTKGRIITPKTGFIAESDTELDNAAENNYKGATYIALKEAGWYTAFGEVIYSAKGAMSLRDISQLVNFGIADSRYDWGYLTNSIKLVDAPGEWYANSGALYIIPPEGQTGSKLEVEARQRYTTFDLTDKSYIHIKDINTSGGSVIMTGEMNILDGGEHKYISHFTRPLTTEEKKLSGTYENCGMYIGGKNNALINSSISMSAERGVILGGRYAKLYGNKISDCGYTGYRTGAGIIITAGFPDEVSGGGGHEIQFNTVFNTGRQAMAHGTTIASDGVRLPMIASEIAYNEFYNANLLARDSGILYENGVSMGNDIRKTNNHHNVYHDSYNDPADSKPNAAIYHDNNTGNEKSHHNVIYYTDVKNEYTEPVYVQKKYIFPDTYSVVEAYDNLYPGYIDSGFDKNNTAYFPDGKVFKYGAVR